MISTDRRSEPRQVRVTQSTARRKSQGRQSREGREGGDARPFLEVTSRALYVEPGYVL